MMNNAFHPPRTNRPDHTFHAWCATCVCILGLGSTAVAQALAPDVWKGGPEGVFGDATNWESGGVPGPGNLAVFSDEGPVTVTFGGSDQVGGIEVGLLQIGDAKAELTMDLASGELRFNEHFRLGASLETGARTVVIRNGMISGSGILLGSSHEGGSAMEVTLRLEDAVRCNLQSLSVGNEAGYASTLHIKDGSVLELDGNPWTIARHGDRSEGRIVVAGTGSKLMNPRSQPNNISVVGMNGQGVLEVLDGGEVSSFVLNAGRNRTSRGNQTEPSLTGDGTIRVSGDGSVLRASALHLGGGPANFTLPPVPDGKGEIHIENGGSGEFGYLMVFAGSSVTIDGGQALLTGFDRAGGSGETSSVLEPGSFLNLVLSSRPDAPLIEALHLVIEGAELRLSVGDAFQAAAGNEFPIVSCGTLEGTFAGLDHGAVVETDGHRFEIRYPSDGTGQITLKVLSTR